MPIGRAILKNIATLGPVGYMPVAPGTWGTLVAAIAVYFIHVTEPVFLAITIAITAIGIWAADSAERTIGGKKDPGCIVIDEVAGYFVSVAYLPRTWGYLVAAFFLFRIFDIVKPPPCHGLQRLRGGWGVMMDDIVAGIYANTVIRLWLIAFLR